MSDVVDDREERKRKVATRPITMSVMITARIITVLAAIRSP